MKKWLLSALFKRWFIGIVLLTIAASVSWYTLFQNKWNRATRQFNAYTQLYSDDCPTMLFTDDQIEFDPIISKTVMDSNSLALVFDARETIIKLPDNAAQGSLFFSPESLVYRGRKKDHVIPLRDGNVSTDSLRISAAGLEKFANEKVVFIGNVSLVVGWLALIIAILILGVLVAAIYMGVDLFFRQRLSGACCFNLAGTVLFILWGLWYAQYRFSWQIPSLKLSLLLLFSILSVSGMVLLYYLQVANPPANGKKN